MGEKQGRRNVLAAERWEPYEARVSRTVLRGPGGEIPPGYSLRKRSNNCKRCFQQTPISRNADHARLVLVASELRYKLSDIVDQVAGLVVGRRVSLSKDFLFGEELVYV